SSNSINEARNCMTEENFTPLPTKIRPRQNDSGYRAESRNGKASSNGHSSPPEDEEPEREAPEPPPRFAGEGSRSRHKQHRIRAEVDSHRILTYDMPPEEDARGGGFKFTFDPFRLLGAIKRRWMLLFGITCITAVAGFVAAALLLPYQISVNLI